MLVCPIVGNNYRPIEAQVRFNNLDIDEELELRRDPSNQYDANAVEVHTEDGHFIGFVPKAVNGELASLLDDGKEFNAHWNGDRLVIVPAEMDREHLPQDDPVDAA